MKTVFWFTRDLRLNDNPALNRAIADATGDSVLALYCIDKKWFESLSPIRANSLIASLSRLHESMGGKLNIVWADDSSQIANRVSAFAKANGADKVYATKSFIPSVAKVQASLAEQNQFQLIGSDYAVDPGTVKKPADGLNYRVYTPFYKAWLQVGWSAPHKFAGNADSFALSSANESWPELSDKSPIKVKAGEEFATRTLDRFMAKRAAHYDENRNRADIGGTSHLSHALAHGEIHPRTILSRLGDSSGHEVFRKEIAWREFYADVLHNHPCTETQYYNNHFAQMLYDTGAIADARLKAWQEGKTGYPMVDAGMRQLNTTGWMHNRVRMIVASFLVKDLHIEWMHGAKYFESKLTDFDPASNSHGWQWTAGCGTDASPYYRIFNPIGQGLKFDPEGDYVRKFVPELRHLSGAAVHEPWLQLDGYEHGYPAQIVDHATERNESLARLEEIKISPAG
jgi:deoxyribodipyrimidine photo-lyase